jgi:hypothetical protein
MGNDRTPFDDGEWTRDERAQLDSLHTERAPRAAMKRKTIAALQARGLLHRRRSVWTMVTIGLAAAAVFVAGILVGYSVAGRGEVQTTAAVPATRELARADSIATPRPARQVVWY